MLVTYSLSFTSINSIIITYIYSFVCFLSPSNFVKLSFSLPRQPAISRAIWRSIYCICQNIPIRILVPRRMFSSVVISVHQPICVFLAFLSFSFSFVAKAFKYVFAFSETKFQKISKPPSISNFVITIMSIARGFNQL